jgi:D-psicose/D-tagatose/L-ribulose 3-epimerase
MEKTMKVGLNTFLFASPFTTQKLSILKTIKEIGFDGVEVAYENKGDIDFPTVKAAIEDNGLECSSICGAFGPGRDLRGTAEEQKTAMSYIRDCVDACVGLGTDIFAGPFYSWVGRANMETAEAKNQQWKTVVKNTKELCNYAEDRGVYIGLEPLNRFETDFINICADAKKMVKEVGSPALKIHLDTFHMNIEEKSPALAILHAGDLLYHVHACENDRGAPGTGNIGWKGIHDALTAINYDRYLVIESFTPEVEIIAKAASIWRETEKSGTALARKGLHFLKALFAE